MSSIREILAGMLGGTGARAEARTSIRPTDVAADLDNLQLVDVREPNEWKTGHVDGAVHIPLGRLRQSIGSIDSDRKVAIICRSGIRSRRGAKLLRAHSIEAVSVSGGMLAWSRQGLPIVHEIDAGGSGSP